MFPCELSHVMCLHCFMTYCTVRLQERAFVQNQQYGYTLPCPGLQLLHTQTHTHTHEHPPPPPPSDMCIPISTHPLIYTHTQKSMLFPRSQMLPPPPPCTPCPPPTLHSCASIYIQQPHTDTLIFGQSTRFYWKAWANKVIDMNVF